MKFVLKILYRKKKKKKKYVFRILRLFLTFKIEILITLLSRWMRDMRAGSRSESNEYLNSIQRLYKYMDLIRDNSNININRTLINRMLIIYKIYYNIKFKIENQIVVIIFLSTKLKVLHRRDYVCTRSVYCLLYRNIWSQSLVS